MSCGLQLSRSGLPAVLGVTQPASRQSGDEHMFRVALPASRAHGSVSELRCPQRGCQAHGIFRNCAKRRRMADSQSASEFIALGLRQHVFVLLPFRMPPR